VGVEREKSEVGRQKKKRTKSEVGRPKTEEKIDRSQRLED
jgi:hypothetical protein